MLAWIFQMLLCSAILYGYYHLFLRNERFHHYNRFYLLVAVVLSLVLPLIKIPIILKEDDGVIYQSLDNFNETFVMVAQKESQFFSASALLYFIYNLIVLVFVVRMFISFYKIFKLKKNNPSEKINSVSFINTSHPDTPFSFFNWLFWNRSIPLNSDKGSHIFRHEMYHIGKKHSLDLIFTELVTALFWFNPIFFLVKKEIKIIQEFLADKYAATDETVSCYAEILLMQTFGTHQHKLVNPFFHNQLKRRIAMLTKSKKPAYQYLRKLMVLPLVAVATLLFAFTYNKEISEAKKVVENKISGPLNNLVLPDKVVEVVTEDIKPEVKDTVPVKKNISETRKEVPFRYYTEQKTYEKLPEAVIVTYIQEAPKIIRPFETTVDISASYPGGKDAWLNFLERNIRGDVPSNNGARPGKYNVEVRFIIEPDGSLSNFESLTDHGFGMEEEVIRVLKKSEKWRPALNNKTGEGREVRAYRIQSIQFQVLLDKKEQISKNEYGKMPAVPVNN